LPQCKNKCISSWRKSFAVWPFYTRCRNCGAKLRVEISYWKNAVAQVLGLLAFWTLFLLGVKSGVGGAVTGGVLGAIVAMLIAMIPGRFLKLKVLSKQRERK